MFFVPIPKDIAKERGIKRYSSNTVCKNGNKAQRLTSNRSCLCIKCLEDKQSKVKIWRSGNKKHIQHYNKDYKNTNKDVINIVAKVWRTKNMKHLVAYNKRFCSENRLSVRLRQRSTAYKLVAKAWERKNPGKKAFYASTRRISVLKSTVSFNHELNEFVLSEAYALCNLRLKCTNFIWHVDHMIPLRAKNVCGLHVWNNFQCLPSVMNTSKNNKLIYTNPHEWLYDITKFFKVVYQQEIAA